MNRKSVFPCLVEVPGGDRSRCPICGVPVYTWRYEPDADADQYVLDDRSYMDDEPGIYGKMVEFSPCGHVWHDQVHRSVDLLVILPRRWQRASGARFFLSTSRVGSGSLVVFGGGFGFFRRCGRVV